MPETKKSYDKTIYELFAKSLQERQSTFQIGETRFPPNITWLLNICNMLWDRVEALEAQVTELTDDLGVKTSTDTAASKLGKHFK